MSGVDGAGEDEEQISISFASAGKLGTLIYSVSPAKCNEYAGKCGGFWDGVTLTFSASGRDRSK